MWTKEALQELIKERMSDYLFIVVSNRQPYIHVFRKGKIEYQRGAGGVITALDPVMQACSGLWVAYGNGDADRKVADKQGKIKVPPDNPTYTLKRVWLTKEEENGYYYGFSNEALWPLCHAAYNRPTFRTEDWEYYVSVNKKFAKAIKAEVGNKKAFVFIQDYHLALVAQYLKQEKDIHVKTAHFWHIPWPNYETFRICPQKKAILRGLLANDLLGFHIQYFCQNFLESIDRELECRIDRERFSIIRGGYETLIRPYPISVDYEGVSKFAKSEEVKKCMRVLKEEYSLSGMKVFLGLDRIDYTKGIPERLHAIDRFIEKYPKFKKKFVSIQMGEISRIHIPRYKAINDEINALVEQINWKHSTDNWKPIILVRRHLTFAELLAFYRLADLCIVSSLHDGMNLVAKEFLSARSDEGGMLVLSQFTGASRELTDAILVNPYDRQQFSDGIYQAITLGDTERRQKVKRLRQIIANNNIFRWAGKIISDLLKLEFKEE